MDIKTMRNVLLAEIVDRSICIRYIYRFRLYITGLFNLLHVLAFFKCQGGLYTRRTYAERGRSLLRLFVCVFFLLRTDGNFDIYSNPTHVRSTHWRTQNAHICARRTPVYACSCVTLTWTSVVGCRVFAVCRDTAVLCEQARR